MTSRRVFLFSFLLTTALLAGLVTVLSPPGPRGAASGSAPPGTGGQSRATGKPIMGVWWADTWSATVPQTGSVPGRALGNGRCTALYEWATARAAVPRGEAVAAFTLAAPEDTGVVVRSLRIVEGRTLPVPRGQDVECVRAVDQTAGTHMDVWGQLSLDRPQERNLSRYVRPGGVIGGVVEARTADCSCEWWIELEVLEDGSPRTVRIDDGGRPFTIAPPVAEMGTDAEYVSQMHDIPGIALARGADTPARTSGGLSAYATRVPSLGSEQMWMAADQEVPSVGRITANPDVPGVVCGRVERALLAHGAYPAGYTTYALTIAGGPPADGAETVADVSLHVEKVERKDTGPTGYDCYPDGWSGFQPDPREDAFVRFAPSYTDALVLAGEPLYFHRQTTGAPAATTLFFGVEPTGPGNIVYHFTVDVSVRTPSGEIARYTLDDAGRPFVLAPRPDGLLPSDGEHTHHEIGRRYG